MSDHSRPGSLFDDMQADFKAKAPEEYTLSEYLDLCKKDRGAYANAAERLLDAIGKPEVIDTSKDPRLSAIFLNSTITRYEKFKDFHGMEETIMKIMAFLKSKAQGSEEDKQILYLLGPVGGGKSSLAERLKSLMEKRPFYTLQNAKTGEMSPVFESPLGLIDSEKYGARIQEDYGIEMRYLKPLMSPWAVQTLAEAGGDPSIFKVVKVWPSIQNQIGIAKVEPGDENNQDISSLVGKVDIRKLEEYSQSDTRAYNYSGALCRGSSLMEFVEMFKAPIKVLHPLLTATQEKNFNGTEPIGAIPFTGIILAHSNETEWQKFRNNPANEAFIARTTVITVPYCDRLDEEVEIYKKNIRESALHKKPCAPQTLEMLAKFSILTRLKEPSNSNLVTKMRVYNGENVKNTDAQAKTKSEYKGAAGVDEGMTGSDPRFAFKVLSKTFNYEADPNKDQIEANPVHLMVVLQKQIEEARLPKDLHDKYLGIIKGTLAPQYQEYLGQEIQKAFMESYANYGQNVFDRYVLYAETWLDDKQHKDPHTGQIMTREALEKELAKIEKPAELSNPKDFRNEVVRHVLRAKDKNGGKNPAWTSYEKLKTVIEKQVLLKIDDILPVLVWEGEMNPEDRKKRDGFVNRMEEKGYTHGQVRLLTDWYKQRKLG